MNRKSFLLSALAGAGCARAPQPAATRPAQPAPTKTDKLVERILDDCSSAYAVAAAYVGDRLGLFRAMAGAGPLTAAQLAAKTGFNERYLLEWLRTVAGSGYLDYAPATQAFELPGEHAAVLADETSPAFMAGWIEGVVPDILMLPRLLPAMRTGAGIPYGDYPPETFDGIERSTAPEYRHLLVQQWLPAVPGLVEKLQAGGSAADLGCGGGTALITLAAAFPGMRAFGYEPYAPSVARARKSAEAAGVAARTRFETFDGINVPGGPYDLITANYSLHHAGKPVALLVSARKALKPGGVVFVVDIRRSDKFEDDIGTVRRAFYGTGLTECLPSALAEGGPGYGTGFSEAEMKPLAAQAGFARCTRVLADDPMHIFFVLTT